MDDKDVAMNDKDVGRVFELVLSEMGDEQNQRRKPDLI